MDRSRQLQLLFSISCSLAAFTVAGQPDSSFLNRAANLLKNQPATEKVYLHLDKQSYGFGDTIWYKAYTVIGVHHQLSALSRVLYVELISPKDSLVARQIIPLVSGVGWSDIPLPHTLKQGNYRVRAYTNWMRNAGPDYFYNQKIRIGGIPTDLNSQKQTAQVNPDVQFFPEGGELVNGVRSRVAFKAINSKGNGENIKGTIIDDDGNVITDFTTQHLGMGEFAFTPQSGKSYTARISNPGETGFIVDLPKAQEAGYTLAVNNSLSDSIYIKVAVNEKTFGEQKNSAFYIIAQSSGKIYYTSQGKLEDLVYSAKLERSRFPSGIAQFTLFSQSGEPLAERIAFIQNNDTLKLNIAAPAQTNTTRQQVKISLNAKGPDNNPIAGSYSVAVINENAIGADQANEGTILNNLLLTSNLKGYIEQPNYYFTNVNNQTQADLDVLMLTQGYRRFEWKAILDSTAVKSIIYPPQRSLELAGTIKTAGGKAAPGAKVNLLDLKENLFRDAVADGNGNFKFDSLEVMDTATLVLRARQKNNSSNVNINLQPADYPAITLTNINENVLIDTSASGKKIYQDYLQQQKTDFSSKGVQLKQVDIRSQRINKPDLTRSSNIHGGGDADQVIMSDQLGSCIDLSDCLTERALFISFTGGLAINLRNRGKMSVIVDGVVLSAEHLNDIVVNDIYSIEVLRTAAARSVYGTSIEKGGALVITMKRGGDEKRDLNTAVSGIATFPLFGYSKTRMFYTPKYSPKNAGQLNLRSTIYWKPNILTDKDGKASFEYFNNDSKGTYRVVVEGIDDNGDLGRTVFRYKVE